MDDPKLLEWVRKVVQTVQVMAPDAAGLGLTLLHKDGGVISETHLNRTHIPENQVVHAQRALSEGLRAQADAIMTSHEVAEARTTGHRQHVVNTLAARMMFDSGEPVIVVIAMSHDEAISALAVNPHAVDAEKIAGGVAAQMRVVANALEEQRADVRDGVLVSASLDETKH